MRQTLDWIYRISGAISVVLLALIGLLTVAQMAARVFGATVPSADDFATFCMAGAIFFGLAYTYRAGGHVRVLSIRDRLSPPARRWLDALSLAITSLSLGWLMWYTQDLIVTSYRMNEHTIGLIPVAMWIPMISMLAGLLVMFIAVVDDLIVVLSNGRPSFASAVEKDDQPSVIVD